MPGIVLRAKHAALRSAITERSRWLWVATAATEARAPGYGGIAAVARATGLAPATITRGLAELDLDAPLPADRVRKAGAGRKRATRTSPRCCGAWMRWSDRPRLAIRSRRCGRPA